jgi:uncharacterized protein
VDLKRKLALLKDAGPGSRAAAGGVPERPADHRPAPPSSPLQREELTAAQEPPSAEDEERRARLEKLRALIRKTMARTTPAAPPSTDADSALPRRSTDEPRHGGEAELGEIILLDNVGRPVHIADASLPGGPLNTPFGAVHVAEEHLEPAHCQGSVPVATALEVPPWCMAHLAVDPSLAELDLQGALFLDTETTGLAGGTGTVPFLVGVAYFDDESLHVEQLFLRQLGQERPLLHRLTELIERSSVMVTYNGKTFDWPLLRTRFVMNQMSLPPELPHLDLLHCARRVLKRRLGALRLVHLEEHILGLHREHDVEGAEIPLRSLDYLRGGGEGQLLPVIEHNAHDLISLAAIMGWLGTHYERLRAQDEPEDHLSLARVARRVGDLARAVDFARAASRGGGSAEVTVDACLLLADLRRVAGDRAGQERALLRALEAAGYAGPRAAPVHLALAKLYEHALKDLPRALRHAELAACAEAEDDAARRRARLTARIARSS